MPANQTASASAKGGRTRDGEKPEADPRGTKVEENRTQGRGKETGEKRGGNKSAETRGGPALIPTNEPARAGEGSGNAETGSDPGGSGNDRRAPWSARVIYPGRNRPSGRGRTGPCGVSRGDAPPCAEPLLLPPCTKVRMRPIPSDYQSLRSDSLRWPQFRIVRAEAESHHFAKRDSCAQLGSLLRANHFLGPDPLIELIIGD